MEGVSKRYGGVRALENADLAVSAGRIHAILGENGAGKSTLIKILSGVVEPDAGRIVLDGREVRFASPAAANRAGIVCIFQELSLVPDLSIADNIAIIDSAVALRHDRSARAAAARRSSACPGRRRGPSSDGAGQGPSAVAPPDGRDRQGAGAGAPHPDPRRGDLGADRSRRRQGVRRAQAPAGRGAGAPVHLAPDARDRRAGRRLHRISQRLERRHLPGRDQVATRRWWN